jgi:hypothetical protein
MRRLIVVLVAMMAAMGLSVGVSSASATPVTVYDATVSPLPGNLNSEGPEAYGFQEFGDEVTLAAGPARTLGSVTATLSSWGCQQGTWNNHDCATTPGAKFPVKIVMNIYEPASTDPSSSPVGVGDLITRVTKTFMVPYRPTANLNHCNSGNGNLGKWWNGTSCFNGRAVNISFNLSSVGITLPDTVVVGLSYNTTHFGPHPIGEAAACFTTSGGCPYDSLNIGLSPAVVTGTKPYPDTLFQNAASAGQYCDGTPTLGTFNLDSPTSPCWTGYVPAFRITAS